MTTNSPNPLAASRDLPELLAAFGLPPDTKAELGELPGCFTAEVEAELYHSTPNTISHSSMIHLLRSPQHYRVYLDGPRDDSTPNLGTAFHSAVLEPHKFINDYKVYLQTRKGAAWEEFSKQFQGKMILTQKEMTSVLGMKKALTDFTDFPIQKGFELGKAEQSIFWIDPETGVQCRIRVDNLTPSVIWDLKSTNDSRPESIVHQVVRMHYDLEAGMYVEGVKRFTGKSLPFIFVFVEDAQPHGVWMHTAGATMIENGYRKFRRGTRAFATLKATNNWHCYLNAISTLELPKYAMLSPDAIEDAANA